MSTCRPLVISAIVLALASATAGCGVPTQDRAEPVDPNGVPPPLLATTTTTTTTIVTTTAATTVDPTPTTTVPTTTATPTTTLPSAPTQTIGLYFVEGTRLLRVQRGVTIVDPSAPLPLRVVLDELEAGLRPGDPPGLRSAVPPGEIVGVVVSRGVATVDLQPSFRQLDGADQELAIAQIVLTLTESGVGQVAFTIAGQTIQIPTAESLQTVGPVTREDYVRQLETPEPERVPEGPEPGSTVPMPTTAPVPLPATTVEPPPTG